MIQVLGCGVGPRGGRWGSDGVGLMHVLGWGMAVMQVWGWGWWVVAA